MGNVVRVRLPLVPRPSGNDQHMFQMIQIEINLFDAQESRKHRNSEKYDRLIIQGVFRTDLKFSRDNAFLISASNLFHKVGAATLNAQSHIN